MVMIVLYNGDGDSDNGDGGDDNDDGDSDNSDGGDDNDGGDGDDVWGYGVIIVLILGFFIPILLPPLSHMTMHTLA